MLQQKILQLKAELESKDRVVVHLAAQLKQAENTLQQIIERIATFANIKPTAPSSPHGRAAVQSHNQQGGFTLVILMTILGPVSPFLISFITLCHMPSSGCGEPDSIWSPFELFNVGAGGLESEPPPHAAVPPAGASGA